MPTIHTIRHGDFFLHAIKISSLILFFFIYNGRTAADATDAPQQMLQTQRSR
jgi:hypothetical protein